jgi:hypothetical protein
MGDMATMTDSVFAVCNGDSTVMYCATRELAKHAIDTLKAKRPGDYFFIGWSVCVDERDVAFALHEHPSEE